MIVFLVPSFTGDVRLAYNPYPKLRERLQQLDERFRDNKVSDVIIFHTGYPFREDLIPLMASTTRHIDFVNIDPIFYRFSPGFEPYNRDPNWSVKGKWNYHHMCYFWFKQVFNLNILKPYRYMMRLDDDSQIIRTLLFCSQRQKKIHVFFSLKDHWTNLFDLMERNHSIYFANKREVDVEYILPGLSLVLNLTAAYIKKRNLTITNSNMFIDLFNSTKEVPNFWNNFEIVELAFMKRTDVQDFIQEIDESKGIFLYRWGDAPLRYIMMTLFLNESQILNRENMGLIYCHPC